MPINPAPIREKPIDDSAYCSLPWVQWFRNVLDALGGFTKTERYTFTASFFNIAAGSQSSFVTSTAPLRGLTEECQVLWNYDTTTISSAVIYHIQAATNGINVIAYNYTAGVALAHDPKFHLIIFRK